MKRRIAYLLTVLALCLFCTACGGEEAAPDDPDDGLGGGEPISEDAADGMESLWFDEDGSGSAGGYTEDDANGDDGNYDSYDVSSLAGIWYYDGDLASDSFIVIDDNGGWSLYQRASGAENAEVDSGWIETADEANTFYAESSLYSDVSYRMYVFETDVMMWGGEDDYYERME